MVKCFTRVEIVPEFPLAGPVANAIPTKRSFKNVNFTFPSKKLFFLNFLQH